MTKMSDLRRELDHLRQRDRTADAVIAEYEKSLGEVRAERDALEAALRAAAGHLGIPCCDGHTAHCYVCRAQDVIATALAPETCGKETT